LWHWTNGKPIVEYGPATSPLSDEISADLKRRGMSFAGSTVVYAFLQAAGMINGHEPGCFLAPPAGAGR
ncbi:MAG TPA: DNA-3-methyladenine glycosylase I, partial [Candidatus Fournierella merdigallinarum]|nr:DNA-3-methyladenine glycosylase I [Candidatus Fournierella merdigallinarum]